MKGLRETFGEKLYPTIPEVSRRPIRPTKVIGDEDSVNYIKECFSEVNPYSYLLVKSMELESYKLNELNEHWNQYLLFYEKHWFYDRSIRTDTLLKTEEEIVENIYDSNSKLKQGKQDIDYVKAGNIYTDINLEKLMQIGRVIDIYGKCGLSLNYENGYVRCDVIEPWRYAKYPDKVRIVYFKDKDYVIQEKGYDRINTTVVKVDKKDDKLTYDETESYGNTTGTLMFEEIVGEQLYTNGKVDRHRSHWTMIKAPRTADMGEKEKPLFEYNSPSIRSKEYQELRDLFSEQIAALLRFKANTLVNLDGATGAVIGDSYNAKRYNKIKQTHMDKINQFIGHYFGDNQQLILEPYSLDNNEAKLKNAVLAVSNGVTTQLPAIKQLYPHATDDEVMTEYLTTEIKKLRPLTLPEVEKAKKLGLIDETYVNPGSSQPETQGGVVGEKQMENADKVNVQGVALPLEDNKGD